MRDCKIVEMKCGVCGGSGQTRQSNGYEKWNERCYQCQGRGALKVSVPK